MHGHSLVSALLVNAEVDSMGGVVDCGIGVNSKASPLHVAIEKVQAELRQEYDVREARRRELEFLENGGNPLDFKVSHIASVSVQSTSLSDQLADQYGISEAKGSFALAPSPHGDSVESSGRLGSSLGREPNIADNLLLFDGDNSNAGGERKVKRNGKRSNATPLEKTAQVDGCRNVKESEDSGIFRIGFKSQAYARRNRSRSSRENSHVSPDLIPGQCKSSVLPHLRPDSKDAKGIMFGSQPEDHAISSIYNSKPASPNDNVVIKTSASDEQIDMELDAVQAQCCNRTERVVLEEAKSSENMQENGHDNQLFQVLPGNVPNGIASQSSDFVVKGEFGSACCGSAPGSSEWTKIANAEKAIEFDVPGKDVTKLHDNQSMEICVVDPRSEALNINNTMIGPSCISDCIIAGYAYGDQTSMSRRTDGNLYVDSNEPSAIQGILSLPDSNDSSKNFQLIAADTQINADVEPGSVHSNLIKSSNHIKEEVELCGSQIDSQSEGRPPSNLQSVKPIDEAIAKTERVHEDSFGDNNHSIDEGGIITSTLVVPTPGTANATLSKRGSATTPDLQDSTVNHLELARKAHEDSILKEARLIEANNRRAGELSIYTSSSERRKKCHWDFVLEEMAWMANDFMQERVWKTTAAAHVCQWIASSGRFMFEQENMQRKQRKIARSLAKAVMLFWHSAEAFRSSVKIQNGAQNSDFLSALKFNGGDTIMDKDGTYDKAENSIVISRPAIQDYAIRFLNYMSDMSIIPILPEAPTTPERISDRGILEMSPEDQLSGASLYYTVAPGAMQAYRESVESLWRNPKNVGNTIHEEDCEGSLCDSVADGHRDNAYEEDEAETGSYFLNGAYECSLSHRVNHKKKKNLRRQSYAARSYEGGDFPYEHYVDGKSASQPLTFNGKRPPTGINVGQVPTKRVRTAARQRVLSPSGAGVAGSLQVTCKTDVSSGDTSSFQDDQSSLHGGSQSRRNFEVESTADFERQLPYDDSEISSRSRKKKKSKYLGYRNSLNLTDSGVLVVSGKGSLYEERLQADSMVQNNQRDHAKKRSENQHFDVNVGSYARHASKRPKFMKHLPETSSEAITPFGGSVPSPVTSQMSNMSSPNKLIKLMANRDRGRKNKGIKVPAGQPGPGSPWSSFEDQALVVLVHDMGTNWELISDAINSTLQFKRIFRKPNECKERHKIVMEKSCDGADSAEDSGSSQPYKSTLPGIPKGSALQLFQYLQGPVEEDTIKAHFEKIILLGQKLHVSRNQNDGQEVKQVTPAHNSHEAALSQVCPNNLSGGILTPLDLCDAITSSSDALNLGYQGSNASGLSNHQSSVTPVLPATSSNTMLQGSPDVVLGNSLSSASTPLNGMARDVQRYGMPRPSSLPADDQQRMQQYNPMFSGRNIQQPNISVSGPLPVGTERGVRMLPGGNGMGVMCGINRGMPMPRPGFQGMSNPGMLNLASTGSMLSGSGVGMPNPVNVHPGAASSQGNSMMRPHSTLQMMRPGQHTEDHRQMMMQELQLQVSQGSGQTVAPFNGMSAPFSNATVPPPVQTFPVQQHQQSHQMPQQPHVLGHHSNIQAANHPSTRHQAYAIRFAKERQLQQRIMPQQQNSFTGSVSPVQTNSQVQQQAQPSSSSNPISSAQLPHKPQQMPRNPQSGNGAQNPGMKQRQRQQIQHQPCPQQQRQQTQHQAKPMKGLGRGTMFVHQNASPDGSHVSGISTAPKNQISEKHPLQPGQGFFSGNTALNPTLSQPLNQPKMFPHQLPQPSKQMPPVPSQSDNLNPAAVHISSGHTLLGSQQPPAPSLPLTTQQQQRQANPSQQNMQRMTLQQNRAMNPDSRLQSSTEQVQANQMITTTAIAQCTDSSPPIITSGTQWKPEPSYDTSTPAATVNMSYSPQESLVGNETLLPPSSQGLVQRQFSGNISMRKSGFGS